VADSSEDGNKTLGSIKGGKSEGVLAYKGLCTMELITCDSTYICGPDLHLLQSQIHCFKANRTTDVTLHKIRSCLSLCP
jgi:hypothetical protein